MVDVFDSIRVTWKTCFLSYLEIPEGQIMEIFSVYAVNCDGECIPKIGKILLPQRDYVKVNLQTDVA